MSAHSARNDRRRPSSAAITVLRSRPISRRSQTAERTGRRLRDLAEGRRGESVHPLPRRRRAGPASALPETGRTCRAGRGAASGAARTKANAAPVCICVCVCVCVSGSARGGKEGRGCRSRCGRRCPALLSPASRAPCHSHSQQTKPVGPRCSAPHSGQFAGGAAVRRASAS